MQSWCGDKGKSYHGGTEDTGKALGKNQGNRDFVAAREIRIGRLVGTTEQPCDSPQKCRFLDFGLGKLLDSGGKAASARDDKINQLSERLRRSRNKSEKQILAG